jgi:hypothetical protein
MAITTLDELLEFLEAKAKLARMAKGFEGFTEAANVESICARMWKELTPHALSLWTVPGVLQHIAEVLAPPADEDEGGGDDED